MLVVRTRITTNESARTKEAKTESLFVIYSKLVVIEKKENHFEFLV